MSLHRTYTDAERAALKMHRLDAQGPSQLSDAFVLGMRHASWKPCSSCVTPDECRELGCADAEFTPGVALPDGGKR